LKGWRGFRRVTVPQPSVCSPSWRGVWPHGLAHDVIVAAYGFFLGRYLPKGGGRAIP
jgi:hypothetical protein